MSELYGIKTQVLQGQAATPVTSQTCVVYFGTAYNSNSYYGIPKHIYKYSDYVTLYHEGTDPATHLSLDVCAEVALSLVGDAWFVNCASSAGTSEATANAIKALLEDALAYICLNSSSVPNIICVPGQQDSALLAELVSQCKGGINNQIHAQGFVDCAQAANQILANGSPDSTKISAPNTDGCLVACWGNVILDESAGTITKHVPASIVFSARRAEQDAQNTNEIPYRSIGNLRINCKGLCTSVSGTLTRCTCRQDKMNDVVENGIISLVNKGNNRWYSWGDHTAAVSAGSVDDETYRFDSNVAVLYHILNRFIQKWGNVIDSPMSLRLRDCILADQQDYINGLKALGCLVGNPLCEFRPIDNTSDSLGKGQFVFTDIVTTVPPAKYLKLGISYTDEGLSAYIEQ